MYAFHKAQFTGASDAALLRAAAQNVLGAFQGNANELFGDLLEVLRSTIDCASAGARLLDGRRLERSEDKSTSLDNVTLGELVERTVREGKPCMASISLDTGGSESSFAGAPLLDRSGASVGCLYGIAAEGRTFSQNDLERLVQFARLASREFDLIAATYTDPATGAMSQWAFDALLHRASDRQGLDKCSVAAIGIDRLDALVETRGRGVGDLVLRAVAQSCRHTLRRTDLLARLGSPRLVALLSDASPEVTLQCMERVMAAIKKLTLPELSDETVSLSIGYVGHSTADLASRVADAEKASYAAARMGGNRCLSVEDLRAALRVFRDRQA